MEDGPRAKRQKGCPSKKRNAWRTISALSNLSEYYRHELKKTMITTNCGTEVKTPTSCPQWSQFLQPPVPGMLVRSSSCAVGMCIYCSSRKACAGSSWLRLGYPDLGDAVHAGWGGFPSSNCPLCPSEGQHCLWATGQALCATQLCVCNSQVTEETLTSTWWPTEERAAVWYQQPLEPCWRFSHCGTLHTVLQSSQLVCPPHPAQGFTTNTDWFPVVFFSGGIVTEKNQLDLKCEQRIQAGSWGLGEWP